MTADVWLQPAPACVGIARGVHANNRGSACCCAANAGMCLTCGACVCVHSCPGPAAPGPAMCQNRQIYRRALLARMFKVCTGSRQYKRLGCCFSVVCQMAVALQVCFYLAEVCAHVPKHERLCFEGLFFKLLSLGGCRRDMGPCARECLCRRSHECQGRRLYIRFIWGEHRPHVQPVQGACSAAVVVFCECSSRCGTAQGHMFKSTQS